MKKLILKNRVLDLSGKPIIMGIVNITPDSFSDGNCFLSLDAALRQAETLVREGADILDLGAESSRPGALPVSLQEELDRLMPVVEVVKRNIDIPLSIDTYKFAVAEAAAKAGADMINDITGMDYNPQIASVVAGYNLAICLMHMRGTPQNMQSNTDYTDLIPEIIDKLQTATEKCLAAGVNRASIVWDPGIGFSKSTEGNLQIIKKLDRFAKSGYSILIGTSRKSFIGKILNLEVGNRLYGTIASNVLALNNGAAIFRVHDVKAHRQALDLAWEILRS